jgi:ATP-binding cassette subfamily F protein 3
MLLHPSNFLLLDEPTNHLDMRAKDVLLEALEKFSGTIAFVSHDRYFIDKLATRVFEIGGGEVHVFPGNYEDYLWRKDNRAQPTLDTSVLASESPTNGNRGAFPNADRKKINPYKLREMQERLQQIESAIARTEAEIADCERALQTFVSAAETMRLSSLLEQRRADLPGLLSEWEQVSVALESANPTPASS